MKMFAAMIIWHFSQALNIVALRAAITEQGQNQKIALEKDQKWLDALTKPRKGGIARARRNLAKLRRQMIQMAGGTFAMR